MTSKTKYRRQVSTNQQETIALDGKPNVVGVEVHDGKFLTHIEAEEGENEEEKIAVEEEKLMRGLWDAVDFVAE